MKKNKQYDEKLDNANEDKPNDRLISALDNWLSWMFLFVLLLLVISICMLITVILE